MAAAVQATQIAVPDDARDVQATLRLGWAIAELRGRYQPLIGGTPRVPAIAIVRPDHALPLSEERSPLEQAIQVESVVRALTTQLNLDFPCRDLSYDFDCTTEKTSEELTALCKGFGTDLQGWEKLSALLWAWDAKIQDTLAQGSLSQASAYQLGRGLAEAFWALDPSVTGEDDARSWTVLLGLSRRTALGHRLDRLSRYFDPRVAPAIRASVDAWGDVASDQAWRQQSNSVPSLFEQIRVWRDLMLGETNPDSLQSTATILARTRSIGPILKAFVVELSILALGFAVAGVAVALLSSTSNNNHVWGSLLAVLGLFGITTAGLIARAKAMAQDLLTKLQATLSAELLALQITVCPAKVKDKKGVK